MPLWSVQEWRARIGTSWCALGRPNRSKSSYRSRGNYLGGPSPGGGGSGRRREESHAHHGAVTVVIMIALLGGTILTLLHFVLGGHRLIDACWFVCTPVDLLLVQWMLAMCLVMNGVSRFFSQSWSLLCCGDSINSFLSGFEAFPNIADVYVHGQIYRVTTILYIMENSRSTDEQIARGLMLRNFWQTFYGKMKSISLSLVSAVVRASLLLRCGDVETNPGPVSKKDDRESSAGGAGAPANWDMDSTRKYRTIIKCTSQLRTALSHNLIGISQSLFANGLISADIYERIQSPLFSNIERAGRLVEVIQARVRLDHRNYDKFVDILEKDGDFRDILTRLRETLHQLADFQDYPSGTSIQQPQSPPTIVTQGDVHLQPLNNMSNQQLALWLRNHTSLSGTDYEEDISKLIDANINGRVFLSLNESRLSQVGISLGFKFAIMSIIEDLKSNRQPPSSERLPLQQQPPRSSVATPGTTQHQLFSSTTYTEQQANNIASCCCCIRKRRANEDRSKLQVGAVGALGGVIGGAVGAILGVIIGRSDDVCIVIFTAVGAVLFSLFHYFYAFTRRKDNISMYRVY